MSQTRSNPWVQVFKPRERANARLFCLPFAGGGAQAYARWADHLPDDVEVCAVQLPGRETRMRETPIASVAPLLDVMMPNLLPLMDRPYFLFGHSMGAIIAYEIARRLQVEGSRPPERLVVSARVAPHRQAPREPIHALPQAEFVEALRSLNGTPSEVLDDAELMAVIGPMLRADFSINETYEHAPEPRLECDIVAFGGLRDPEAPRTELEKWREVTGREFQLRMVPGDHFFIHSAQSLFLRMLSLLIYQTTNYLPFRAAAPPSAFQGGTRETPDSAALVAVDAGTACAA
jgi:medium-chain acyl-[acyl-carrier-protein] hydrolase